MVALDNTSFILPLSMVEECVDLNHEEIDRIKGRNILNLRGEAVPFIRLREKLKKTTIAPVREQVVITSQDGRRTGVVVDSVIGSHQTVLKPLGRAFRNAREFSGATILGDGSVALILDVNK
jgi:two-component system chemotaxis sensor kinase CheA